MSQYFHATYILAGAGAAKWIGLQDCQVLSSTKWVALLHFHDPRSAKGAVSFFDIGEHELCESPHEETQVKSANQALTPFQFHCVSSVCLTHDDGGGWCAYPSFTTQVGTTGMRGTTAASTSRLGAQPDPHVAHRHASQQ